MENALAPTWEEIFTGQWIITLGPIEVEVTKESDSIFMVYCNRNWERYDPKCKVGEFNDLALAQEAGLEAAARFAESIADAVLLVLLS